MRLTVRRFGLPTLRPALRLLGLLSLVLGFPSVDLRLRNLDQFASKCFECRKGAEGRGGFVVGFWWDGIFHSGSVAWRNGTWKVEWVRSDGKRVDVPPANTQIAGDCPERILEWLNLPSFLGAAKLAGHDLIADLVTTDLSKVAASLASNVNRAINLSNLPRSFYSNGRHDQLLSVAVNTYLGRSPVLIDATYWSEGPAIRAGFRDGSINPPFPIAFGFEWNDIVSGIFDTDSLASVLDLMAQQLVMVWTAFETLAGDLWEACINARPKLGYAALGAAVDPQSDEEEDRKRKAKLSMPLSLLEDFGFNVRDKMGTVLRRHQKWNFSSRREAREAYLTVFEKSHHAAIRVAFDDKRLRWLFGVRNAVVHAAGAADRPYFELVAGHPVLSQVLAGAQISIDGAICYELVPACLESCRTLLQFVDRWMVSNQ